MPSSSALCASIAPRAASPMAQIPGTLVAQCSSVSTMPRAPTFTPIFSRPRPSVYGTRPVETSTMSASIVSASPPFTGSVFSTTPPPGLGDASSTFVDILNCSFCFLKILCRVVAISVSIPGVMRSRNSTTVTSEPSRRHTDPISRPMTPAPMTISFLGTSLRARAPVEETITFSSIGTLGSDAGTDPVATTMFFVLRMDGSPPSIGVDFTSPAERISPDPMK
mmetsp:Transcript_13540/g.33793  ORF Transcript_13540/g.33793 Transcript_13540/m.33793 type:complete len:223 (-) Transcript_13540:468-1136(-)